MAVEKAEGGSSTIGKLTVTTIGAGAIAKRVATEKKELVCARLFGMAAGIKIVKAANGDTFEAITGSFEAHNAETGEVFQSGILYLPSGLHERVVEPLKNDPDSTIEFGIEISAYPAGNPQGYSWKAKPLFKASAADPLAQLRTTALSGFTPKALPAPEKPGKKKAA